MCETVALRGHIGVKVPDPIPTATCGYAVKASACLCSTNNLENCTSECIRNMDAVRKILDSVEATLYLILSWILVVGEEDKNVHTMYIYSMGTHARGTQTPPEFKRNFPIFISAR